MGWFMVIAGRPYIIVKFHAVASYITDDPFFKIFCRSSISTESLILASNSNIAAIRGASGCLLGTIRLPSGIIYSSSVSPI